MTYLNQYILIGIGLLIIMVVIINVQNIYTIRKISGLFFNSALSTRSYSSLISKNNNYKNLDPNWVSGLVDAEGSFIVFIKLDSNNKVRQIQLSFEINLHIKYIELLNKFKSFFGEAGSISIPSTRKDARLKITSINEIYQYIIPHFKEYPLHGMKKLDYDLWAKCAELILNKEHLQKEGLYKILSIKSVLNKGFSDKLKTIFPDVKAIDKPILDIVDIPLNPNYVSGFSEGESCFSVNISSKTNQIIATYIIELHSRDILLLQKIKNYFKSAGFINSSSTRNTARFYISRKSYLINIVLPHFDVYQLQGNKLKNYLLFKEIVLLINSKAHLTPEGFNKIKLLKEGLNK